MSWALYAGAGYLTLGTLAIIGVLSGGRRKQVQPGTLEFVVMINAVLIVVTVLAARRLS